MVPTLHLFLAMYRLFKSTMVADLHVELAVIVLDRRQNVAAVQIFRPEFLNSDCVEVCV